MTLLYWYLLVFVCVFRCRRCRRVLCLNRLCTETECVFLRPPPQWNGANDSNPERIVNNTFKYCFRLLSASFSPNMSIKHCKS